MGRSKVKAVCASLSTCPRACYRCWQQAGQGIPPTDAQAESKQLLRLRRRMRPAAKGRRAAFFFFSGCSLQRQRMLAKRRCCNSLVCEENPPGCSLYAFLCKRASARAACGVWHAVQGSRPTHREQAATSTTAHCGLRMRPASKGRRATPLFYF